jgi:hypothetical protein
MRRIVIRQSLYYIQEYYLALSSINSRGIIVIKIKTMIQTQSLIMRHSKQVLRYISAIQRDKSATFVRIDLKKSFNRSSTQRPLYGGYEIEFIQRTRSTNFIV